MPDQSFGNNQNWNKNYTNQNWNLNPNQNWNETNKAWGNNQNWNTTQYNDAGNAQAIENTHTPSIKRRMIFYMVGFLVFIQAVCNSIPAARMVSVIFSYLVIPIALECIFIFLARRNFNGYNGTVHKNTGIFWSVVAIVVLVKMLSGIIDIPYIFNPKIAELTRSCYTYYYHYDDPYSSSTSDEDDNSYTNYYLCGSEDDYPEYKFEIDNVLYDYFDQLDKDNLGLELEVAYLPHSNTVLYFNVLKPNDYQDNLPLISKIMFAASAAGFIIFVIVVYKNDVGSGKNRRVMRVFE